MIRPRGIGVYHAAPADVAASVNCLVKIRREAGWRLHHPLIASRDLIISVSFLFQKYVSNELHTHKQSRKKD